MPTFTSNDLGGVNDKVTLRLDGQEVLIAETYSVQMSWFRQPSIFALRTGWGGTTTELLEKYPPNTRFELLIADRVQFTGRIDEIDAEQSSGATEVTFKGRDDMAALHDSMAIADRSFDNDSYDDVVSKMLTSSGYKDFTLIFENDGNRDRKTGLTLQAATGKKIFGKTRATTKQKNAGQIKVGDQNFGFVKKELDRAGLFLFASADTGDGPQFIISEPNGDQSPMARIVRRRGLLRNAVNVTRAAFKNDTSKRYCKAVIYGRGGDPKTGQQPVSGSFIDNEMLGWGFPPERVFSMRADKVSNAAQAEYMARKAIAEQRRDGWSLQYSLSGHTVPALNGRTSKDRAVWSIDTTVEVEDDEYGIAEKLWVSDVAFSRDEGGTRTDLTFMRPGDLLFAAGEAT